MTVAINQPVQQKSPLEAIANAVQIVNSIHGMKVSDEAIRKAQQDAKVQEEELTLKKNKDVREEQEESRKKKDYDQFGGGLDNAVKKMTLQKLQNEISSGKRLPADKVLSVNEGNVIPRTLEDIRESIVQNKGVFGPIGGRLASMNPYSERAQTLESQFRSASQQFGRYMEGGVLRKEDEEKYRRMFPQLKDTPEVAANKLSIVDRLLKQKQASDVEQLTSAGYNVGGLNQEQPQIPEIPGAIRPEGTSGGLAERISEKKAVAAGIGPHGASVTQGGHTYTWNPKSKRYE